MLSGLAVVDARVCAACDSATRWASVVAAVLDGLGDFLATLCQGGLAGGMPLVVGCWFPRAPAALSVR